MLDWLERKRIIDRSDLSGLRWTAIIIALFVVWYLWAAQGAHQLEQTRRDFLQACYASAPQFRRPMDFTCDELWQAAGHGDAPDSSSDLE